MKADSSKEMTHDKDFFGRRCALSVSFKRIRMHYLACTHSSPFAALQEAFVGDTLFKKGYPVPALPGFKPPKPMVFAGVFPVEQVRLEATLTTHHFEMGCNAIESVDTVFD